MLCRGSYDMLDHRESKLLLTRSPGILIHPAKMQGIFDSLPALWWIRSWQMSLVLAWHDEQEAFC
jgi:hypothetical protein